MELDRESMNETELTMWRDVAMRAYAIAVQESMNESVTARWSFEIADDFILELRKQN